MIRSLVAETVPIAYMGFRDSKLTRLLQPCFDRCYTSFLICMTKSGIVRVDLVSLRYG